ncbi:MAG TPA: hypothetical protein VGG33_16455, partial [Polyangia bacterium]
MPAHPARGVLVGFLLLLGLATSSACGSRRIPPPPGPAVARDAGIDVPRDTGGGMTGTRTPPGACTGAAEMNKPLGARCGCNEECSSNQCVDGVCCNSACTGTCQACNVAGRAGTCSPLPDGAAPVVPGQCLGEAAATCGLDGLCDGRGACRRHPDGTVCDEGRCDGNQIVDVKACAGGSCQASGSIGCAPYACDASNRRCHARCT